jgi:hypothetical protein
VERSDAEASAEMNWSVFEWKRLQDAGRIANDIGATRKTVEHYVRFCDQMQVAAAGDKRPRPVEGGRPGTGEGL